MTTTYSDGEVEQSSSYLDPAATEAAIGYLNDNWPHQQLTPSQRDAWIDILCQLHPGELKPALAKMPGRFRPDAYAVLEVVLASRAELSRRQREHDEKRLRAEQRAEMTAPPSTGAHAAAEAVFRQFSHLMPSRRNLVPSAPDLEGK